ncbi:MAG: hypothetical protein IH851_06665 [Armatimonadetes bacterium]|nr:hypothetical protein [Armatimonadota bacterium]
MPKQRSKQPKKKAESQIRFHHIKSNLYREVHAEGAWGGVTPSLKLHFSFYSQRNPIPQQTVHELKDGALGKEILELRVSKEGVIREVEVGVFMDLSAAKVFHKWLSEKIKELEKEVDEAMQRAQEQSSK